MFRYYCEYYPKNELMDNNNSNNDYEYSTNNYSNANNYCFTNNYYNRSNTNNNEVLISDYNYEYYQRNDHYFNHTQDMNHETTFNCQQSVNHSFDSNFGTRDDSSGNHL